MIPVIIISNFICELFSVFIRVGGITLYPFIVLRPEFNNKVTINHEKIHIEQQKELLVIFFYILYVYYWLKGKIKGLSNHEAYMSIPFEKEAYENDRDFNYLNIRKKWNWKNYIN